MTTSPTEFLYSAAMLTPDVLSPMAKPIHYDHAELGTLSGRCFLCGRQTEHGFPKKTVIKDTFTDHGVARAPESQVVCEHCAWALSYFSLRNYSILAGTWGLQHPSRVQIRSFLLAPAEPPYLLCVAESGQRWLHFKGIVTLGAQPYVRFEDVTVRVDVAEFTRVLSLVEQLYAVFTKEEIATARYQPHRIQLMGVTKWQQLADTLEPIRKARLAQLALFVAQREETNVL